MPALHERLRFQIQVSRLLESIDDPTKLYKTALSQFGRLLRADGGAVILSDPVAGTLRSLRWGRARGAWSEAKVRAFLEQSHPALPPGQIMAPILVAGRAAGVMVLTRTNGEFEPGDGRWLTRLCRKLSHEATLREERRIHRIVDQIKDKTVRELRPKDLFYQILHGLRALTRYDHSSALLIAEDEGARLVLHAEQIAWTKGKSDRIGRRLKVSHDLRSPLNRAAAVRVVSFPAPRGRAAAPAAAGGRAPEEPPGLEALARLLRWGGKDDEPPEGTLLLAPLQHDGRLLGVLKIAACRPAAFGPSEADGVARVLRHVASVIHNARRALSMEERIIEAEKKHAMADLARAISHDVKNAIGAILPLAQQAREEIASGQFDLRVLAEDLQQIEQSAQICQRIFDGMLQLARSAVHPVDRAPLGRILEGTLSILGTRLRRAGVTLDVRIPDDLPEVDASRGGLEQLFLNLFTNGLDSMPAGGRLKVQARAAGDRLEVRITDTGAGIPPEQLKRIHEPFFTTKSEGFGLGLAICRSILWEVDGEMSIDSQPGKGTTVTVLLPVAAPRKSP